MRPRCHPPVILPCTPAGDRPLSATDFPWVLPRGSECMSGDTSDEFQKSSLISLSRRPTNGCRTSMWRWTNCSRGRERHHALIGTLTAGVTNLGGSAATINLPDVNRPVSRCPSSRRSRTRRSHFPARFPSSVSSSTDPHGIDERYGRVLRIGRRDGSRGGRTRGVSGRFSTPSAHQSTQASPAGPMERNLIKTLIDQMEGR
jgi:hypothetical protein